MATYQSLTMVSGSTLPALQFTYTDSITGNPVNLTGYTVSLEVQRADKSYFTRTAVVANAAAGLATFTWQATDWSVIGRYFANFVLVDATGAVLKVGGLVFMVTAAYHA